MNFNEYQKEAHKTADYNTSLTIGVATKDVDTQVTDFKRIPAYPLLKITAEAAEILDKVSKVEFRNDTSKGPITEEWLLKEAGDCLWYVSEIATILGVSLETVAEMNIAKLRDRAQRGVIHGSGDTR